MSWGTRHASAVWGAGLLTLAVAILAALAMLGSLPSTGAVGPSPTDSVAVGTAENISATQGLQLAADPPGTIGDLASTVGSDESQVSPQPVERQVEVVAGIIPAAVIVPDLSVTAPVVSVGLESGGGVFVPEDVATVGWYTGSMPVGADAGSTVLVGHRDSRVQGQGALGSIELLNPGSQVTVVGADGVGVVYAVSRVEFVEKADFATIVADAFSIVGDPRLTLITCGGQFDSSAGSYLSNVIVTATPVAG